MDKRMDEFVSSKISKTFNLDVDTVADKCKTYGRFSAWLGGDINKIKEVLNKVKSNGVSPAFFAGYERSEGYNEKWGWLNHTKPQGDYLQDADAVSKWIVQQSKNMTDKPAWIDFANYKDFVPAEVKKEGDEHFAKLPSGTIGRVVIAGTAAATWEVYYPQGLKKEYNGVQDYAAPINVMIDSIIEWGGSLEGDDGGGDKPDPKPDPKPDWEGLFQDLVGAFEKLGDDISKKINEILTIDLYNYNNKNFGNSFLYLMKQLDNMYKIKPTINLNKAIKDIIDSGLDNLDKIIGGFDPDPKPDPDPDPEPDPDDKRYFPVNPNSPGVNFWYPPYESETTRNMDYGTRTTGEFHAGYDIGGGGNEHTIYAVASGTVTKSEPWSNYGTVISIDHDDDKYHSFYAHLKTGSNIVKKGDKVKAGQKIAVMGASGGNYAIHLHFELSPTGEFSKSGNTVDPKPYLKVVGNNKTELPIPKD